MSRSGLFQMPDQARIEEHIAKLRSRLHAAHLDSGKSLAELTRDMGLTEIQETSEYLSGKKEIGAITLMKFARATGKPVWWFYGEEPAGVTVEGAETALQNISKVRLYLEALEGEFLHVVGPRPVSLKGGAPEDPLATAEVVDLRPYLAQARRILEKSIEESGEVSLESVEMVAHELYSAEMGLSPVRHLSEARRSKET